MTLPCIFFRKFSSLERGILLFSVYRFCLSLFMIFIDQVNVKVELPTPTTVKVKLDPDTDILTGAPVPLVNPSEALIFNYH